MKSAQHHGETIRLAIHYSSRSEEWYTPQSVIDRVVQTLGGIDLDPCSNSRRSPIVPAKHHFTKRDDGLSRQWHGRVFMNPPYGREVKRWVSHLCGEYQTGRVHSAIALLHARTDTAWFHFFRDYSLCFVRGRLRFRGQGTNSAPFPSVLIYLGTNESRFIESFGDLGDVYRRADCAQAA